MSNFIPTSLYRYYDSIGVLLYVGITSQRSARNIQHNTDKIWWEFVHRQEVDHYPTRGDALKAERALIQKLRPPFNVVHNPDKGELGRAYLDYRKSTVGMVKPGHLMQKLKGKLPLVVHERGAGAVTLRSFYEHWALASRVSFPDDLFLLHGKLSTKNITHSLRENLLFVTVMSKWASEIGEQSLVLVRERGAYTVRRFQDRAMRRIESK